TAANGNRIISVIALNRVDAAGVRNDVVAHATEDDVVAEAAFEHVISAVTPQRIVADAADQRVRLVGSAENDVIAAVEPEVVFGGLGRRVALHQRDKDAVADRIPAFLIPVIVL